MVTGVEGTAASASSAGATDDLSGDSMRVSFYGVRGSTPCSGPELARYGGNTACVVLEAAETEPIVFDLGTGLRYWGETQPLDGSFGATALVTHLHWDHVQGLPFFPNADRVGARFDIYAPCELHKELETAWEEFMRPPYFPVKASELRGDYNFRRICDAEFAVGRANVMARPVPHVGDTNGYRVSVGDTSVAYISDHQQPEDPTTVDPHVLDLARGVDLLIHDAQYTPEEFAERAHWGHCTVAYAIEVAVQAEAKCLALFHHDPSHEDKVMDALFTEAQALAEPRGVKVICAREGLQVSLPAN